jgi:aspartyl-tRNA(Asn)/glutamyl-tRNA(Gln) amidotransferase subunit B
MLDILAHPHTDAAIDVTEYIKAKGLAQVSDPAAISAAVDAALAQNQKQLADYCSGKTKIRGFFFGAVMKAMDNKANTELVNQILDEKLQKACAQ